MKERIQQQLNQAIQQLADSEHVILPDAVNANIDYARDKRFGDYASNVAMVLAKVFSRPPQALAQALVRLIQTMEDIDHAEVAGPGFINITLSADSKRAIIALVLDQGNAFGHSQRGQGQRVLLEYVSANPTGPLHVGHGRGAAVGASIANILKSQGYTVHQEYYVNDAGRQMHILTASILLQYANAHGLALTFPRNGYRGDYVVDIATALQAEFGQRFLVDAEDWLQDLPADADAGGDKEGYIDALVARLRSHLPPEDYRTVFAFGLRWVLDGIKTDLATFRVNFDSYFSEQTLADDRAIEHSIEALRDKGWVYEAAGALWFKAAALGDEKDRVLRRSNGETTYFASDVAYHWQKYQRGFTHIINLFGADHHGYVARIHAAATALGYDKEAITMLLIQFAVLYRNGEKVAMSTRSGQFETLRDLCEEVGVDATRFFYVQQKSNQHMDFDMSLATTQTNDNPVYYVQYAHARIASVFRQLQAKQWSFDCDQGKHMLHLLDAPQEWDLITQLMRYPDTLQTAAKAHEPHLVAYALRELAQRLHSYYNAVTLLTEDDALRNARLCLIAAVQTVLHQGLALLGVSAPETM